MDIVIDEPTTIRGYIKGGMGGWGYSSTPLHRLTRRTSTHDEAVCGSQFRGQIDVKPAGRDGRPRKSQIDKYGLCKTCWPEVAS